MSVSAKKPVPAAVFNIPNQLTTLRLALSIVLFVLMAFKYYLVGTVVFVVAASTDWLDGYLARKWNLVTVLGRILDPFVDKIIVCGTFIFLAAEPQSQVAAWMAVTVVGRELLITALRSFLEQQGADFSATMSGKLKMVLQCLAATASLFYLSYVTGQRTPPGWLLPALIATVWGAVILTVYSGVAYVVAAARLLKP
ncbi:MAG: CDP-diacylglycerol--glycerol-3-phosphate 3-phosphatidyltransferase [Pirellulales bacterium]